MTGTTDRTTAADDAPSPGDARASGGSDEFNALLNRFPKDNLTVLAHFYRGELSRANAWRAKMDQTTYWGILTTTALTSFAFTQESFNPLVLPAGSLILFILLNVEGRRFRYFDVWRTRVRMLEVHLLIPALVHQYPLQEGNWREMLVRDILKPTFKLSHWESIGRRLRRNYVWLFLVLLAAWFVQLQMHRAPGELLFDACAVRRPDGSVAVPAWAVATLGASFHVALISILLFTGHVDEGTGEIRGRDPERKNWPI